MSMFAEADDDQCWVFLRHAGNLVQGEDAVSRLNIQLAVHSCNFSYFLTFTAHFRLCISNMKRKW